MGNTVIDICKERAASMDNKCFPLADRLEHLGLLIYDRSALPPMVILFELSSEQ